MTTPVAVPRSSLALAATPLTITLAGLGHRCRGACTQAAEELGAQLWFVRRDPARRRQGVTSLVVVDASDYTGSRDRARQLLREINDCLRPDGIRMGERRIDDCGVALATVIPMPHHRDHPRAGAVPVSPARSRS